MKKLYKSNKCLMIINAVLFIIPYFGLMFLVVLGTLQVIMALIIIPEFSLFDKIGKIKFIIYFILTSIVLTSIFTLGSWHNNIYPISIIVSIPLAFLNLNITYLSTKIKTNETTNS